MKRWTIVPVLGIVASLCHCDPCSTEPASFVALSDAVGHEFGYQPYPKDSCAPPSQDPGRTALSAGTAVPSACAPAADDDACITCAKTSCCTPSLDCWQDAACTCLVACRSAGCTAEEAVQCGALDAKYDALAACLHGGCAEECPKQ